MCRCHKILVLDKLRNLKLRKTGTASRYKSVSSISFRLRGKALDGVTFTEPALDSYRNYRKKETKKPNRIIRAPGLLVVLLCAAAISKMLLLSASFMAN